MWQKALRSEQRRGGVAAFEGRLSNILLIKAGEGWRIEVYGRGGAARPDNGKHFATEAEARAYVEKNYN